jgi:hypothetical protein
MDSWSSFCWGAFAMFFVVAIVGLLAMCQTSGKAGRAADARATDVSLVLGDDPWVGCGLSRAGHRSTSGQVDIVQDAQRVVDELRGRRV